MWGFLAFLLVLVPIIWCVYSKRRRGTDETPAAPAYPVVDAAPEPAIAHPVTPAYIPVAGQEPGTYVYNPATASEPEIHVDQGARAPLLANKGVYHEHFRALLAK